jgi:hypothetical protein
MTSSSCISARPLRGALACCSCWRLESLLRHGWERDSGGALAGCLILMWFADEFFGVAVASTSPLGMRSRRRATGGGVAGTPADTDGAT